MADKSDKFSQYRENLVVEQKTHWPEGLPQLDAQQRGRIESQLHAAPAEAAHLNYLRLHSGFCRQITVTEEDLKRLGILEGSADAGE
jgi:hypothetical protein